MATEEQRKNFFLENQEECENAIYGANMRRKAKKLPQLTDDEIDVGIDEMIKIKANGHNIDAYIFPNSFFEEKGDKPLVQEITAVVSPPPASGVKFSFDVIKCSNGFLMNMTRLGAAQTFIFKTRDELSEIFDDVIFEKQKNQLAFEWAGNEEVKNGRTDLISITGSTSKKPRRASGKSFVGAGNEAASQS